MAAERNLIVNADDFGLSAAVNAGILEAHERGIVTSTSIMVRKPAAGEAAALATPRPSLAIGLHLDLGQWDYDEGEWRIAYENCPPDDPAAVDAECRAQVDAFRALLGREPTHLDSHQHAHEHEPAMSVATTLAAELGLPLRGRRVRYEGGFYGQSGRGEPYPEGITTAHLIRLVSGLEPGWTEFGCHPGIGVGAESSYAAEREIEVGALCDPLVKEAIDREGVRLRSFAELD
jgi:chitin disaccharide deacetylase